MIGWKMLNILYIKIGLFIKRNLLLESVKDK